MDRCNPVEMRKNLGGAQALRDAGIDFVAIPAKSAEHKLELIALGQKIFDEILEGFENEEDKMGKCGR